MRVKTWVNIEQEVEVDVSARDILNAFAEDEEEPALYYIQRTINNYASFCMRIPDERIAEMSPGARKTIRDWFITQADRYKEED